MRDICGRRIRSESKERAAELASKAVTPTLGMRDCLKSIKSNFVRRMYFPIEIRQPKLRTDTKLLVMECRTVFKKTDPEAVPDKFQGLFRLLVGVTEEIRKMFQPF